MKGYLLLIFLLVFSISSENSSSPVTKCSPSCECDIFNGLRRTTCINHNLVDANLMIPNNVQIYNVSYNSISKIDDFCFKNQAFRSIIELDVSNNQIFWIGLHGFSGLPHVKKINLAHNRIEGIPPDLFLYNKALEEIDLSGNKFLSVADQPFIQHQNLKILNLKESHISYLPMKVFFDLPNLIRLDISGNNLVELDKLIFDRLDKLTHLILDENEWQCDEKFKQLEDWIAKRNIHFELQCNYYREHGTEKMFEKIIALKEEDENGDELPEQWDDSVEITPKDIDETVDEEIIMKDAIDFFNDYDARFPSSWSLMIGFQIGVLFGAFITYCCITGSWKCKSLSLTSRRERLRIERRRNVREGREHLLWSLIQANTETPPIARRQISTDDGFCRTNSWERTTQVPQTEEECLGDGTQIQESAFSPGTPPPAYDACINDRILSRS